MSLHNEQSEAGTPEFFWHWHSWEELSKEWMYRILAAREAVFVVEQSCPYQELDGRDPEALHLYALGGQTVNAGHREIAAYLRLLPPGAVYQEAAIGRVLTTKPYRSFGLARDGMIMAIEKAGKCYPEAGIRLSAQCYLQSFYENLGFLPVGEPYDEDGIPHIEMLLRA